MKHSQHKHPERIKAEENYNTACFHRRQCEEMSEGAYKDAEGHFVVCRDALCEMESKYPTPSELYKKSRRIAMSSRGLD